MKINTLIYLFGALEGREYSFERGQDGLIECSPPNNVISTTFKQGTKQLFIGIKSQNATPIMESRFVLNDYTYSDTLSKKQATMKLSLPNVQLEDEGSYSCENQIGESEEIKITVTVKPEVNLVEGEKFDIEENSVAKFATCTAQGAKPQPDITWFDDQGKPYDGETTTKESDDTRLSTVESVLKIENINRNDHHDRSFVCKVKQNDIEVDSKTTNSKVNVLYAPEQPNIPSSTEFVERSTASISCEGNANPQPSYSWQVKNENVTDINQTNWVKSDDGKTITKEISLEENGLELICVIENELGRAEKSVQLMVTDTIQSGAAKGAFVYSIIGVICLVVLIAGFVLLRRVIFTKKAVYKTEGDKDETHESLKDDELEAGKKKEYFM